MKKLLSFLLISGLIMFLAACGSGDNNEDAQGNENAQNGTNQEDTSMKTTIDNPVTVEFWHAMSGHHEEVLQQIADNFNNEHENITVKLVNQGSYGDLNQKIMASAKAKKLPVMAQAYEDWVTEYIDSNLVQDLTPYVNNDKIGFSKDELNDIVEVFRHSNQWDGKYYSMPFNKSTRILFYNTGMFEENGLEAPTTWEELRTAAETLTNEENGKKVVGLGLENSIGIEFNQWIKQAGGEFINEETGKVEFNNDKGIEALSFVNDMIQDGVARLAGEDGYMSNPFGRGDVGMYIGSSAGIPFVASAAEGNIQWSATPLPAGEQAATPFAGTNLAVFSSASDDEKLAAWEFIKYAINTENTAFWAKESGYLPVRYSALESDEWKKFIQENPVYGVGEQQFDAGFYDPRLPGAYAAKNAVAKEVEAVLAGQKTVEQGVNDAAEAAQTELDRAAK